MPNNVRKRGKPEKNVPQGEESEAIQLKSSTGYCGKFLLIVLVSAVAHVGYIYYYSPLQTVVINDLGDRLSLEGKFEPNNLLHEGKRILEGYPGPECVAFDEQENLYTGLHDGRILKVAKDNITGVGEGVVEEIKMTKFHENLGKERPLGMRFFKGYLYVADCYLGIYKLDVKTGKREMLVHQGDITPPSLFLNDLTISRDGKLLFFSSSSASFNITEALFDHFSGHCTGSVYKYDIQTKNLELFVYNLCFANGVQLSPDDKILLIAETSRFRVSMYDIATKTIKKAIRLPMYTDNIRPSIDGGYFVGLILPWSGTLHAMLSSPLLRRVGAGLLGHHGIFEIFMGYGDPTGYVKLNANGDVEQFVCDSDSAVAKIATSAIEDSKGNVYIGSFMSSFVVKIKNVT